MNRRHFLQRAAAFVAGLLMPSFAKAKPVQAPAPKPLALPGHPNPDQTWDQFYYEVNMVREIAGQAHVWIISDQAGRIVECRCLPATRTYQYFGKSLHDEYFVVRDAADARRGFQIPARQVLVL